MDAELAPADQAFADEVSALFARLTDPAGQVSLPAWRKAVVARGWSVPKWPLEHGGTNWRTTQHFIWDQACGAHLHEDPYRIGRDIVGPLLLRLQPLDQDLARDCLAGIRAMDQTWCVAAAEPLAHLSLADLTSMARPSASGGSVLHGEKAWVHGALTADRCCCLYRAGDRDDEFELGVIDLHAHGTSRREHSLVFSAAPITGALWRGSGRGSGRGSNTQAEHITRLFTNDELGDAAQLGMVAVQLAALRLAVAELAEQQADTAGLETRLSELGVDFAGVQALQQRYLDALEKSAPPPFPRTVLPLRTRELAIKVGELLVESFGYYALPYPDAVLSHNEGPVAPADTASAPDQGLLEVSRLLAATAGAGYSDSMFTLRDVLSEALLTRQNEARHTNAGKQDGDQPELNSSKQK